MKKQRISDKWRFSSPDINGNITVNLPHDYSVKLPRNKNAKGWSGGRNGAFTGSSGTYTKYLTFGESNHTLLDIDGAYMCTRIYFNDNLLDMHPSGYMPYIVDLSPYIRQNRNNKIELTVQNLQPSTRWYSGAGVYRDVFVYTGGKIRIEPWDLYVTTENICENEAKIAVRTDITSDIEAQITVKFTFTDKNERIVLSSEKDIAVNSGSNGFVFDFSIKNPLLWDCENPDLYTLFAEIIYNGKKEDEVVSRFGIRSITADAENGLRINGKNIKLRGGCIHHDYGVLGVAEYPAAVERKLKKLKSAGYNAIRSAHNPPSDMFLELCDKLGIIVMDEAFDMWNKPKTALDYSLFFRDWWARDIKNMIKRDRSHPCVISYSVGNEIPEHDGNSNGYEWVERIASEIRKYDNTRFVTSGIDGIWHDCDPLAPEDYREDFGERVRYDYVVAEEEKMLEAGASEKWAEFTEPFAKCLDIVGYNYLYKRYALDRQKYPNRVIWGSETQAKFFYESWQATMANPCVIGDFTWTAHDNLGESGAGRGCWGKDGFVPKISIEGYPWRICAQGDFDICGNRKPQSYFREAIWKNITAPHIFTVHPKHNGDFYSGTEWHWDDVHETWTFGEEYIGKSVCTCVYTTADEIVFCLNGNKVACVKPCKGIAGADIPYEIGELTAQAYRNGEKESEFSLKTVGEASKIKIVPEKTEIIADERDLCYFNIFVTDEEGNIVIDGEYEISISVYTGKLMGIFGGNPCNEDDYGSNKCHTFEGTATAVVSCACTGDIKVYAYCKELGGAFAEIYSKSKVL